MTDNKEEIIKRLIEVKIESGLITKNFAEKAGIDPRHFSSIITGKRTFGDRVMNDICRAFNINAVWLKIGKGEKYATTVSPDGMQSNNISMPREVFDQITKLTETVLSQQKTIDTLIEMNKKTDVHWDDNVICADASGSGIQK
jgi:hypothetical protein